MSKVLSVRVKEELYTKMSTNELSKTELVSKALNNFLEPVYYEKNEENKESVYNEAYSNLYNLEVVPLKKENVSFQQRIEWLESEVFYLRQLHRDTMDKVLSLPPVSTPLEKPLPLEGFIRKIWTKVRVG